MCHLINAALYSGQIVKWDKSKMDISGKAGKDTMAKDLAAGDRVTVRYMDHDGKATAMNVNVSAAKKAETKPAEKK